MKITYTQLWDSRRQLRPKKSNLHTTKWPRSITLTLTPERERTRIRPQRCSRKYTRHTRCSRIPSVDRPMTLRIASMRIMGLLSSRSMRILSLKGSIISHAPRKTSIIRSGLVIRSRSGSTLITGSMFVLNTSTARSFTIATGTSRPGLISPSSSSS